MAAPDPARERELFAEALDLTGTEREAFLAGLQAATRLRIERLLRAHERATAAGDLEAAGALPATEEFTAEFAAGAEIGPYRIVSRLGSGGMGEVHLAEQVEPVRRLVALKIIKLGMDTREVLARFHAERQALARMSHPNIAQIHDAGATQRGRPYFVMEYVSGDPITQYCDTHELDSGRRIDLFLSVCEAMEHAHQKGVIHRDLKPSNILVTTEGTEEPLVKVIDFGIAKATGGDDAPDTMAMTQQGQVMGTPRYMSPEQAGESADEVDTRSDVYSLGVVLYELLTGTLPFDLGDGSNRHPIDQIRALLETDPLTPSEGVSRLGAGAEDVARKRSTTLRGLRRSLRGEIEWVLLRALAREPRRRYQSVEAFAQDLRRLLEGLPVDAGPPSELYRIQKIFGRHRYAVAFAGTVLVLILAQSLITAWQSQRIAEEAQRANEAASAARDEAETSSLVTQFVRDMLAAATPEVAQGTELTVREILEQSEGAVDRADWRSKPRAEAGIRKVLGRSYLSLALYDRAKAQLDRVFELASEFESPVAERIENHLDLAAVEMAVGHMTVAEEHLATVELLLPEVGEELRNETTARHLESLAGLRYQQVRREEALELRRAALEQLAGTEEEDPLQYAQTASNLAFGLIELRRDENAEELLREAIELLERTGHARHPQSVRLQELLGWHFTRVRQWEEALLVLDRTLERAREVFSPEHPRLADVLNTTADLHWIRGDPAGCKEVLEECIAIRRAALGDHPDTSLALERMADILVLEGDLEGAEATAQEVLGIRERAYGAESIPVAMTRYRLATIRQASGDREGAIEQAQTSVAIWRSSEAPDSLDSTAVRTLLANQLMAAGDTGRAIEQFEDVVALYDAQTERANPDNFTARYRLVDAYLDAGRFEEARAVVVETRDGARTEDNGEIALFSYLKTQRAAALAGLGRVEEAVPLALEGWEGIGSRDVLPNWIKYRVAELVRRSYAAAGDEAETERWATTRDGFAN